MALLTETTETSQSYLRNYAEIDTWMSTGQQTDLPEILQGIFFMDGNSWGEGCLTYDVKWDAKRLILLIPVFAPLQWTFSELRASQFVRLVRLHYEIQFENETLTQATITPILFGVRIPHWIVKFTMTLAEEDPEKNTWYRRNFRGFWQEPIPGYMIRRVVSQTGQKTSAFADMLTKVPKQCFVIPRDSMAN